MSILVNKNDVNSRIKGNVSPELKQQIETLMYQVLTRPDEFGSWISKRVVITEASILPKAEEASRTETRVVCEITVEEDMLKPPCMLFPGMSSSTQEKALHGSCAAFLIDICSTLVFVAAGRSYGVTASMGCVYHAPAALGSKLRIVNTGMAVGARIMSARTEIWDDTKKRLCITGIHVKMQPSPAKGQPKL